MFKIIIQNIFLSPVYFYRYIISPFLPCSCRFAPTCSEYAVDAIKTHGIFYGGFLTIKRLCNCHPWGKSGFDPVPTKKCNNKNKKVCD